MVLATIVAWAAVALWVVVYRGRLSPAALRRAPRRRAGITGFDLLVGVIIFFCAVIMVHTLMALAGDPIADDAELVDQPPMTVALSVLLDQLSIQGPVVMYVIWRARRKRRGLRELGIAPRAPMREIVTAGCALPAVIPFSLTCNLVTQMIGDKLGYPAPEMGHEILKWLAESPPVPAVVLMAFSTVVVAPILEEVIYRGLLQTALLSVFGERRRWTVVVIAAACFALIHIGIVAWQTLPGLFVLGVVFGYLYERTGSLWPSILTHALFNGFMFLLTMMSAALPQPASVTGGVVALW